MGVHPVWLLPVKTAVVLSRRLLPPKLHPSAGTFRTNTEIARDVATRAPYAEWLKSCARKLTEMNASK